MDANLFDELIQSLPVGGSRRQWLAAALSGGLGLFGLNRLESSAQNALKKCKRKKGRKKKKCLKKAKEQNQNNQPQPECRDDQDCPDVTTSCQGGRCRAVCPPGACPADCETCVVRLETDGDRSRLCGASPGVPPLITACDNDAECPQEAPLCINFAVAPCAGASCGTCVESIGPCGEPECQNDGDCDDQIESCQGGSCQLVCPAGACPGCNFCAVRFETGAERSQQCADTFLFPSDPRDPEGDPKDCTTDEDCTEEDTICIRFPTTSCNQPPCGQCALEPDPCE
jgi:hypothetical protein